MEPVVVHTASTKPQRRSRWRVVAFGAASTIALAACGASATGTPSTTTPGAPTSAAPSIASTPAAGATPAPDAAQAAVGILNFQFTPAALTVKAGTTVVWTNNDAIAHTVNFMTAGINSKVLNHNDQFTHTFTTPGTYDYICSIHPFMHASITVTA